MASNKKGSAPNRIPIKFLNSEQEAKISMEAPVEDETRVDVADEDDVSDEFAVPDMTSDEDQPEFIPEQINADEAVRMTIS